MVLYCYRSRCQRNCQLVSAPLTLSKDWSCLGHTSDPFGQPANLLQAPHALMASAEAVPAANPSAKPVHDVATLQTAHLHEPTKNKKIEKEWERMREKSSPQDQKTFKHDSTNRLWPDKLAFHDHVTQGGRCWHGWHLCLSSQMLGSRDFPKSFLENAPAPAFHLQSWWKEGN